MKLLSKQPFAARCAFTLVQTMIGMAMMATILGAVYTSSSALLSSMKASENYSVGQLMAVDYMTLDLRRAQTYSFTTVGTTLTLPLTLGLPQYYDSTGTKPIGTPNVPQRVLVTSGNFKNKKDHKVFNSRYYYYYGTLGGTVGVQYTLQNGTLYRKEGTMVNGTFTPGSLPARAVGSNIQTVTFGPDAASIAADPVVTTTVTFSKTQRAKQAPPPLSSTTFMREYYYSDY